ncbi:hypothetical protein [Microlunatus parietis]|uniref:Tetratricopeptide repeat-containing protein n=1 Tax=Microlunatus parietis TaxID=682979 RepID=A0A7Y9I395_9ACTN|nr:hypothetical protein [Microlunatus parietis]NYE69453.1 hypothetical protein [Microlunatus parietis]
MSTDPSPPAPAPDPRRLLDLARSEYRRGSLERAWQACREAAAIGRATGDAGLLADAATVIPGPAVGAWSLTAERHARRRRRSP